MRLIALITGILLFASLQTASAQEDKKPAAAAGTSVEMPYLIAPLSDGNTLLAYAYVSCKIIGTSQATALEIRGKVPFIQDAFVRDVNAASIAKPGEPLAVDTATLESRLLALAKKVMGPGKVVDLKLIQVQVTPLRAGPTPPSSSPS
ncbi:MAG TPA: hypothetical protein VLT91_00065 [Rhizomicrobium sp.]|nr:hypothetical protein [Rhizomicrobium sp.]